MAENPVSYWESSSSSAGSSAGSNASNTNNNHDSNASNTSNDNDANGNDSNASNSSSTGSYPSSSTDSWKSHPWPADPVTTTAAATRDLPTEDEEEVIFELNEEAMAQLPAHLQHNMRNIQRERMERVQRENAQVPVRRYRAQREREEEEKRRADEWFRGLIARLPPPPVLGLGVGLGRRRDEGGGDRGGDGNERNESPSPRGPGRRGHTSGGDGNDNDNNAFEDLYTDGTDLEHTARYRGRRIHHHHRRAASSKGKAAVYGHSINSQPYLPGSQSAMGQYTRHPDVYEGQQEEEEYDQGTGSSRYWKKRAGLHGRVKRSIGKMSRVFKKE